MPQLDNINQSFKSARMKINAFLRRQRWKEALIFFFFVLLSLGFWLLQSLQQEYEIEINIPVRYKNIPPDISFTETPPQVVIAKVKDKGSVLLNYSFGRSFAPIETNMKNQAEKSGSISISKKAIENDIQKQLLATTSLLLLNLSTLKQHTANVSKKRFLLYSMGRSRQTQVFTYPVI